MEIKFNSTLLCLWHYHYTKQGAKKKTKKMPEQVYRITNLFLTEREDRTGEYWPEVVAVRTERSKVRTKTTEGQYSSVRSRASEVSK